MSRLAYAAALWALLLGTARAEAIEPRTVSAEGVVELEGEAAGNGRDLALKAALVEAALVVARDFVAPEVMEVEEQRIREALEARASGFVMTYRVERFQGPRPSPEDPLKEIFSAQLSATVDAAQVRGAVESVVPLQRSQERPSVVLQVVRRAVQPQDPSAPLDAFEHFLTRRLESEGIVVVDPALRAGGFPASQGFLERARGVGADLAVEIGVRWWGNSRPTGVAAGTVEVRVQAVRVRDGAEIALARFESPAYHEDPDEAFARAVEAVQRQVAENLLLQLGRNWEVLASHEGPVQLRLLNVTSLLEVDEVRKTLRNVLGAEEASLISLAPAIAEIIVRGPLSPGALQDRLVAVAFDDFRLRPVEVSRQLVELRVEKLLEPESEPRADPLGDLP
jgi:hypothetical protein